MSKRIVLLLFCVALLASSGCCCFTAEDAWTDVLSKCAVSELNGNKILYFGPSNNVGPGSIWREPEDGGFRLRNTVSDMPRKPIDFIHKGTEFSCNGAQLSSTASGVAATFESSLSPIDAELSADLKAASNINMKVDSCAWDEIKEKAYENYIMQPINSEYYEDLERSNRYVLSRALRVHGYSVELKFSKKISSKIKASYSGQLAKELTGKFGAELSTEWTSDNTLRISAKKPFYIAGEMSKVKSGVFASRSSFLGKPVTIDTDATARVDE